MHVRTVGYALAAGLATFLLVLFVEAVVLSTRLSVALPVAAIVGLGFGALALVRAGDSRS